MNRCDAVFQRRQLPGLAAVERQDPRLGSGVVDADLGADEGQNPTIRGDGRARVSDAAAGQLSGRPRWKWPGPEVRNVVLAVDATKRIHHHPAVRREAKRLEPNLGADQRTRCERRHPRASMHDTDGTPGHRAETTTSTVSSGPVP